MHHGLELNFSSRSFLIQLCVLGPITVLIDVEGSAVENLRHCLCHTVADILPNDRENLILRSVTEYRHRQRTRLLAAIVEAFERLHVAARSWKHI